MTVLAAVDDDEEDAEVVSVAHDLATAYGEELVVLHVMDEDQFRRRRDSQPDYYRDTAAEDAADVARDVASMVLDEAAMGDVVARGRIGNPVEEILEEGDDRDARYIVSGGRKRTPVGKAVFGSATQSLLLNATRPVVTVMHE